MVWVKNSLDTLLTWHNLKTLRNLIYGHIGLMFPFGFTGDMNPGLLGESPLLVWTILLNSKFTEKWNGVNAERLKTLTGVLFIRIIWRDQAGCNTKFIFKNTIKLSLNKGRKQCNIIRSFSAVSVFALGKVQMSHMEHSYQINMQMSGC